MEKSSDASANFRTCRLSRSAPASYENWNGRGYHVSIPCSIDIPVSRQHEEYGADWRNDAARIKYNNARERYDSSDYQDNPELYRDNQYQAHTHRNNYELNQKSSETTHKQLPPYVNIVSLLQDSQVEIVLKFHGTPTSEAEKPSLHQDDSDVSSSMDNSTG